MVDRNDPIVRVNSKQGGHNRATKNPEKASRRTKKKKMEDDELREIFRIADGIPNANNKPVRRYKKNRHDRSMPTSNEMIDSSDID